VIMQTLRDAVPERALQIAAEVGRRCARGVLGAVDCCLSGPASPSSAQADEDVERGDMDPKILVLGILVPLVWVIGSTAANNCRQIGYKVAQFPNDDLLPPQGNRVRQRPYRD